MPPLADRKRALAILVLALAYVGAGRIPLPSGLAFQAYLFWPAAALTHTALFILGVEAWWGLLLGSLLLNATGWLPWPQALAMVGLQALEPLVAWRLLVALGCPHPDPGKTRDLFRWLGVAASVSAVFSAGLGTLVVGSALPQGFHHPSATGLSWFLGDLAAILCLGPSLLLFLRPLATGRPPEPRPWRIPHPAAEGIGMALLVLLLLFAGRIRPGLTPDFRLAAQFALVLPALWMALRLGPRGTAAGTTLLALSILVALWTGSRILPEEAFRFSQLFLLVLALATLTTAAAAEEARAARQALELRDLQGQRMEAVATLAGGLVHEFNNQLTVMLGNLDRLREPLASVPAATGLLARLEEAALALEGTVRQLKGLSHQAPLRAFSLPLEEALAPFLAGIRELPARIRFETKIPEGLQVGLDPELLRQALQLLLTNSLEAIVARGHIWLTARQEGPCICLVLEDDGPGMAPEVLRRACDPFFTTKPVGQGRGLGLSIAFSLARQMGGDLVLDSAPGRGTRAELHLPRGRVLEPAPQPPAPASHPRRILLADDEAAIRELTREILAEEGFEVVEARDGQEALEAFEADPETWDLAILDLVMPRLHGSDVLLRIQALRPDLPVLLISGYNDEARPGLLDGPHRRFLAKPFRIRDLIEALASLGVGIPPA
ncbi:MAG TPA: ATP-binding protein [Holophagaceae bacterium]